MKVAYLSKIPRILALRIKLRCHGVQHGQRLRGDRLAIKNAGTIVLGDNVSLNSYPDGEACRTGLHTHGPDSVITIGSDCLVNGTMIFCRSSVHIGDNCMFGPGAKIVDNDAHRTSIDPATRRLAPESAPIVLHDNVWIGMNALVLKGVEIGRNSVVAAYSVVTKDVPENVLVAGNPARVVKTLTE